jgi:hypothetical protein
MNDTINKIKELLGMEVQDEVVLMEEKVLDTPKADVADEVAEDVMEYATKQEVSEMKSELLAMISTIIDEKEKKMKEVPQELSSEKEVEQVELSEVVQEIVHSPENEVKKEAVQFSKPFGAMSIAERINEMLNNK